jgi:hypothetical protein
VYATARVHLCPPADPRLRPYTKFLGEGADWEWLLSGSSEVELDELDHSSRIGVFQHGQPLRLYASPEDADGYRDRHPRLLTLVSSTRRGLDTMQVDFRAPTAGRPLACRRAEDGGSHPPL